MNEQERNSQTEQQPEQTETPSCAEKAKTWLKRIMDNVERNTGPQRGR